MKQHYPLDPVTGIENPALAWANGNPATGTNGSYPPFGLFLDPQKEILAAQRAGGLNDSADGSDTAQLAQAIARGTWLGTLGQPATVNDLVGALQGGVTFPALLVGMEFSGVVLSANTGPMTLTLGGFASAPGKANLVNRDGTPLAGGDIAASTIVRFRFDGASFLLNAISTRALQINRFPIGRQTYASAGTYTFTVPAGVYRLFIKAVGPGGGGGGANGTGASGAGGGSGAYAEGYLDVTPGQVITIIVGSGGTGGVGGSSPGAGGTGGTTNIGGVIIILGGTGGSPSGGGVAVTVGGGGAQPVTWTGAQIREPGKGAGTGYPVGSQYAGGLGASSRLGAQTQPNVGAGGIVGLDRGCGGNGSSANAAGGAGADGYVDISW